MTDRMKSPVRLLFPFLLTLLASCASGPPYKKIEDRLPPIPEGSGRLLIYRPSSMGAAVTPSIKLNDVSVAKSKAKGFLFLDCPAGDYRVSCSTEAKHSQSVRLEPQEVRYIRLGVSMGLFVGHITPLLVPSDEALAQLASLRYYGDPELLLPELQP